MKGLMTNWILWVLMTIYSLLVLAICSSFDATEKLKGVFMLLVVIVATPPVFVALFRTKAVYSTIGKLTLTASALVILFMVLELFSRMFIPHQSPFDLASECESRKPFPYIAFKGDPQSDCYKPIGYRDSLQLPKNPSEYRVFLLGGSTVAGGDPPISKLLEERFVQQGDTNVRVYNFGVISSNTNMDLARVVFEVADHGPDLIIFYNGGNDVMMPYGHDPRPGYPFNFHAFEHNVFMKSPDAYPTLTLWAFGSNLLRVFFRDYFAGYLGNVDRLREQVDYRTTAWEDEIARQYISSLWKAERISHAFGADFIAFLQPTVYHKRYCTPSEESWKNQGSEEFHYNLRLREKILQQAQHSELRQFSDLSQLFEHERQELFIDWVHVNGQADRIIADRLFEELNVRVAIPRPSETRP